MAGEIVTVNSEGVTVALRKLRLNLQRREKMYRDMGLAMLVSVRRTFREQGSPAGSWVPLAASTITRNPKKYGGGHKLLVEQWHVVEQHYFQVTGSGVHRYQPGLCGRAAVRIA